MLVFPNAKLNLGLYVTAERRPDGFHTLESVFVPLPWTDALELLPAPAGQATSLTLTGRPIPGAPATNLCLRAYELLQADFPQLPPVQIYLHKIVPIGAGLGGGSADAAFALKATNDLFGAELIPREQAGSLRPPPGFRLRLFHPKQARAGRGERATCSRKSSLNLNGHRLRGGVPQPAHRHRRGLRAHQCRSLPKYPLREARWPSP